MSLAAGVIDGSGAMVEQISSGYQHVTEVDGSGLPASTPGLARTRRGLSKS
jgi:hypothetical protein